jgi:hypothetical protein
MVLIGSLNGGRENAANKAITSRSMRPGEAEMGGV